MVLARIAGPEGGDQRGYDQSNRRRPAARCHDTGRGDDLRLHHRASIAPERERSRLRQGSESIRRARHYRHHRIVRLLHAAGHAYECGAHAAASRENAAAGYVSALISSTATPGCAGFAIVVAVNILRCGQYSSRAAYKTAQPGVAVLQKATTK